MSASIAVSADAEPSYVWKANEVLRFEYEKNTRTSEELGIEEVSYDHPVTLSQPRVELVEFQSRIHQAAEKTWKLGMSRVVAAAVQGESLTLTGAVDEDERRQKWVEVRNDAGATGYVPGTTTVVDTREFSFDAILILEIKNKTPDGTFAVLHFDDPRIIMPESYIFASAADDPALQKDRTKAIVHVLEGAVKQARWNVTLDKFGLIHIKSRTPDPIDEWLKETEHTAFWRNKYKATDNKTKAWVDIVEKNLGLAPQGDDRELFLALRAPALSAGGEMDKIRPFRSAAELISNRSGKAEYRFRRLAPPHAGDPYTVGYVGWGNIVMNLKPVIKGPVAAGSMHGADAQIGSAIFDCDARIGLLDSLSENYSFETEYLCDLDSRRHYRINQTVSVKYNLKRLAPPIVTRLETATDVFTPAK